MEVRSARGPRTGEKQSALHKDLGGAAPPPKLVPLAADSQKDATPVAQLQTDHAREAASVHQDVINELSRPNAVWSPQMFNAARLEMMQTGCWNKLNELTGCVKTSTDYALRRQRCILAVDSARMGARPRQMDLSKFLHPAPQVEWFGRDNVVQNGTKEAALDKQIPPPILLSDASAVDVALTIQNLLGKSASVYMVAEQLEFAPSGELALDRIGSISPSCLPLRTDFRRFADIAASSSRRDTVSMKTHLCAASDAYVLHCPGVSIFRGSRDHGFPFLEEPVQVDVVLTAMSTMRPSVTLLHSVHGRKVEMYANEADQRALQHRLDLVASVALQESQKTLTPTVPVLVLGMPGYSSGGRHPRDAMANVLKQWRRRFSPHFHTIFLCTGGRSGGVDSAFAQQADTAINKQVYRLLDDQSAKSNLLPWHWDTDVLRLAVAANKLLSIASLVNRTDSKDGMVLGGEGGFATPPLQDRVRHRASNASSGTRRVAHTDSQEVTLGSVDGEAAQEAPQERWSRSEPVRRLRSRRQSGPAALGGDGRASLCMESFSRKGSLSRMVLGALDQPAGATFNDYLAEAVGTVGVPKSPVAAQSTAQWQSQASMAALSLKEKMAKDVAKVQMLRDAPDEVQIGDNNMDFSARSQLGSAPPSSKEMPVARRSSAPRTAAELQMREDARREMRGKGGENAVQAKPKSPKSPVLTLKDQESATKAVAGEARESIRRASKGNAATRSDSLQGNSQESMVPMQSMRSMTAQVSLQNMKHGAGMFAHIVGTAAREHTTARKLQKIQEKREYRGERQNLKAQEEPETPRSAAEMLRDRLLRRKPRQPAVIPGEWQNDVEQVF